MQLLTLLNLKNNSRTTTMSHPLSCLFTAKQSEHLNAIKNDLVTKGWSFLHNDGAFKYDRSFLEKQFEVLNTFCLVHDKTMYSQVMYPHNRFGYFQTDRKEGYRFMTGTKITEFEFPDMLKEWKNVALACDKLSTEIYNLHGKYLFHSSETPNG
jgi:hypothetical protein